MILPRLPRKKRSPDVARMNDSDFRQHFRRQELGVVFYQCEWELGAFSLGDKGFDLISNRNNSAGCWPRLFITIFCPAAIHVVLPGSRSSRLSWPDDSNWLGVKLTTRTGDAAFADRSHVFSFMQITRVARICSFSK